MSIVDRIKAHYESDDFKSGYLEVLFETFADDENDIINNILRLFNISNYETETYLSNHKIIDRKQAKLIYDFIYNDLESFVSDFSNYYVGYTSLCSVSFGEQEQQLEGLYNNKTGKEYNISYLKKVFANDFYVGDNGYAYYTVSGGLHVELINESLNEFLKTI